MLPPPPHPAGNTNRVHLGHPHAEQLFHRVFDRRLVGIRRDLERVLAALRAAHALLGQDRPADDRPGLSHRPYTSASTATAGGVRITTSATSRSCMVRAVAARTVTRCRFDAERASIASGAGVMMSVRPDSGSLPSSSTTTLVRGASSTGGSTTRIFPSAAFADSTERMASRRTLRGVSCA